MCIVCHMFVILSACQLALYYYSPLYSRLEQLVWPYAASTAFSCQIFQTFKASRNWAKAGVLVSSPAPMVQFFFIYEAGMEPSPLLLRPFIGLLCQLWAIDINDYGAVSEMNEWQGKPAPVPICPPRIPHDLTVARSQAAAVGSRPLTASVTPSSVRYKIIARQLRGRTDVGACSHSSALWSRREY
jgi:hypothetical protein